MATALGYFQITDISTAKGFTDADVGQLTIPAETDHILIIPEGAKIRYRDDGTNPTASVGMPIGIEATITYRNTDLTKFKVIQQSAGGKLNGTYYAKY